MVPWVLKGIIADLDGHAKLGSYKTVAGTIPCVTCSNVCRFIDTSAHRLLVGIDCCEPDRFIFNSDASVFAKADELRAAHDAGLPKSHLDQLSLK